MSRIFNDDNIKSLKLSEESYGQVIIESQTQRSCSSWLEVYKKPE